jgi:Ca2+ transporting ATPase
MCVLNKRNTDSVSHPDNIDDYFEIKNNDLIQLMKLRGIEAVQKIDQTYGGMKGLAERLHTDLVKGLPGDVKDLNKRVLTYGKNEIPAKASKSFLALMLDAMKETTLVILIICAFVSIGLSFYHPPDDIVTEEKSDNKEGTTN